MKPESEYKEYHDYEVLRDVGGRDPFYETPEEMSEKAIEYFEYCAKTGEKRKVTGLVLFLGFKDKKSLRDYKEKPEFSPLIKKMLTLVEKHYEDRLDENNPAGAIFALKNMGWGDTVGIDHTSTDGSMSPKTPVSLDDWYNPKRGE